MSISKPIAMQLAQRIHAFDTGSLTPKAQSRALIGMIDTIGVTLIGAQEPCVAKLRKVLGGSDKGDATLIGLPGKASMLDAVLINGTSSHALDYDDFSGVFGGHQSAPLVPALLSLAEAEHFGGQAVLTAYAVGVETEIRLARAVHFHHYDKGWHPTATLGTIGAAAATAHLMGLDQDQIAMALAIAVSHAAGVKANFGTMTKPLHVGMCSRAGLLSALLAREGFTANHAAFEHAQGFFEVFNGAGNYDPSKIFENWANPLELEDDSIAIKPWPCCGSAHAAIAAALALRKAEKIIAADIAKIEVMPHPRRLRHTNTPHPITPLEAKFSVQYVVARALNDGAVKLAHFEPKAVADSGIHALLNKLTATGHPDMSDSTASQWAAEVVVTLKDGRRVSHRIDDLMANAGSVPAASSGMWNKFIDCADAALAEGKGAPLFERLETFDSITDMAALMSMLGGSTPRKDTGRIKAGTIEGCDVVAETHWVP